MGRLDEIDGIIISVPSGDHYPPHVHVTKDKRSMRVQIADHDENRHIKVLSQPQRTDHRLNKKEKKKALKHIEAHWEELLRGFKDHHIP